MAFGQRRLDRGLTLQQPVQRGVQLVLIDLTEAEQFTEARMETAMVMTGLAATLEPRYGWA
jgi:hypothetical protein